MGVLILSRSEVEALLTMRECITAMETIFQAAGRERARQPLRPIYPVANGLGYLGLMPSEADDPHLLGLKAITAYPGNHAIGLEGHQGLVILFDGDNGTPLAIMDAAPITAIRTAAASALATKLLAREGASDLAILGAGVQAASHLEAMTVARKMSRVRVWSRNPASVRRLIDSQSGYEGTIEAMETAQEAVEGAEIICTVSGSTEPILDSTWISDGTHINAVGAGNAKARELDTATVQRARVWVDSLESALNEAGDLLIPIRDGSLTSDHIAGELSHLVAHPADGRQSDSEVTVFESLGVGIEDLAAAALVVEKARAAGVGTSVDL